MISVINQFEEDNLNIEFSGDVIDTKNIKVSVSNDVNFKPIIDYLIQLIPKRVLLKSAFAEFDQKDNFDKLNLIKETINEIYEQFNSSLKTFEVEEQGDVVEGSIQENDDLPF